jgi:tRNA(Ile)-lysidine synthetase-like protein
MSPLAERVSDRLAQLAPAVERVLVAVSGGPDSVALLDLLWLARARHGRTLVVGHVDHGIAPGSAAVAEFVNRLAGERDVECRIVRLGLGPGTSETRARLARRRALRGILREVGAGVIVLAHHAHDQHETVLLRVLGGSGPVGLAGMAPRRGIWVRPLLDCEPADLARHLASRGIEAWRDPANADPRHLRSWLRTSVLPLLESRIPDVRSALARVAHEATEHRVLLNSLPEALPGLDLRPERHGFSVAAGALSGYRSGVQHAVLTALGRRLGVPFGRSRVAAVLRLLEGGRSGRRVRIAPGLEAELTFERLVIRRPPAPWPEAPLPELGEVAVGAHRGRVTRTVAGAAVRDGWRAQLALPASYRVRAWRPGDRIRPLGGTGSRRVADLFAERRVARGERGAWPVIAAADATIVWVPGICRSEAALPAVGQEALDVEFAPR